MYEKEFFVIPSDFDEGDKYLPSSVISKKIKAAIDEFGPYKISESTNRISFRFYRTDGTIWGGDDEYTFDFNLLIKDWSPGLQRWDMIRLARRMAQLNGISELGKMFEVPEDKWPDFCDLAKVVVTFPIEKKL